MDELECQCFTFISASTKDGSTLGQGQLPPKPRPCPLSSTRQHPSYGDCLEVEGILSELFCAGLCDTMFTVSSTLISAVRTGPTDWVCHIGTLTPCVEAVA